MAFDSTMPTDSKPGASVKAHVVTEPTRNDRTEIDSVTRGNADMVRWIRPNGWHEELVWQAGSTSMRSTSSRHMSRRINRPPRASPDAWPTGPRSQGPQPLFRARGRQAQGEARATVELERGAELRPRQRRHRRACHQARHALRDPRPRDRRQSRSDRRRAHDPGRRLRLLGPRGGRPQRPAAGRRLPARQGEHQRNRRHPGCERRSIHASRARFSSSRA